MNKTETDFINKTEKAFKNMLSDIFENESVDYKEKIVVCAFMAETLHNVFKAGGVDEWFSKNFLNKGDECFKVGKQVHRYDDKLN